MTKMTKEQARASDIEALEEEERVEEGLPALKPKSNDCERATGNEADDAIEAK